MNLNKEIGPIRDKPDGLMTVGFEYNLGPIGFTNNLQSDRFPVVGLPISIIQAGYSDAFLLRSMQKFILLQIDSYVV